MPSQPVRVQLKAAGGAPLLRRTKFKCDGSERARTIQRFLRAQLELPDDVALFLFVQPAAAPPFAPAPDDALGELAEAFFGRQADGAEREVILAYSTGAPAYAL
jgi:hypothetical protein